MGDLLCPQRGAAGIAVESQDVFGHLPAGLAVGAVSVSAGRGCLAAVFVLICSLCLLAAELKLVQRESRGLLSPGLFPLSAHAAAIRLQAGDTQGQGHGGGRTMVTRSRWQEHGSTPVTPIPPLPISLPQASPQSCWQGGFVARGVRVGSLSAALPAVTSTSCATAWSPRAALPCVTWPR